MKITVGGIMQGISNYEPCETCKWAKNGAGEKITFKGDKIIIMSASKIFDCTNKEPKDMNLDDRTCSGWAERKEE